MKSKLLTIFAASVLLAGRSEAANLFFDPVGDGSGDNSGNWSTLTSGPNQIWASGSLGSGNYTFWTNGDNATFAGSSTTPSATLLANLPVSASSLTVNSTVLASVSALGSNRSLTVTGSVVLNGDLILASSAGSASDVTYTLSGAGVTGAGNLTLSSSSNAGKNLLVNLTGSSTAVAGSGSVVINSTNAGLVGFVSSSSGASLDRTVANSSAATTLLAATAGNTLTLSKAVSGSSAIQIGSQTLGDSGTVALASGASLTSTNKIDINAGTLLLNVAGSTDLIADTTNIQMSGSGAGASIAKFAFGNASGVTETVGTLTLAANSVIDFGTAATGNTLKFTGVSSLGGFTLQVWNYTPGVDHLFFGTSSTGSGLAGTVSIPTNFGYGNAPGSYNIRFFSDNGSTPFFGGTAEGGAFLPTQLAVNGQGEIVPVPEPTAVLSAGFLLLAVGWRERRLFARVRGEMPLPSAA